MVEQISESESHDIEKLKKYVESCKSEKFDEKSIVRRLEQSAVPKDIIQKVMNPDSKSDKKEKNSDEYDRDSDAISHEEMENLESKEMGFVERIKKKISDSKKSKDEEKDNKEENITTLNNTQLSKKLKKLEKELEDMNINAGKRDGKLEVLSGKSDTINEELENASEKIGELRSTVMGRERLFNKLEDDMNQVKYVMNNFKPELLEKKFNQIEAQMIKIMSSIEKDETREERVERQLKTYESVMEQIKDYDSILKKLSDLKGTENKIERIKLDIEKMNSKIEVLYHNIEESIGKINIAHDTALNNQSAIKEMLVSIGKIEQNVEMLTKKEEFNQLQNDVHLLKKSLFMQEFNKPEKKGLFKK